MLPPTVVVTRQGAECLMAIHVPHGDPVSVQVVLEDGSVRHDLARSIVWVEPREVDGNLVGRATVALPTDLPMGWHTVHARSGDRTASSVLVVTPRRLDPACAPRREPQLGADDAAVPAAVGGLVGDRRPHRPDDARSLER